jgi:hypothetical protein
MASLPDSSRSVALSLVWCAVHIIKNHFSTTLYKALLVRKQDFAYECLETGDIFFDGCTPLQMIYMVVKPNVIVNLKDLQVQMEKMTIIICDKKLSYLQHQA